MRSGGTGRHPARLDAAPAYLGAVGHGLLVTVSRFGQTAFMQTTELKISGPYDLAEVAMMSFGHRDLRAFDGVMRMAFCLDGPVEGDGLADYDRQVGVGARQVGDQIVLEIESDGELNEDELSVLARQVARVISVDADGEAFHQVCLGDTRVSRIHEIAPGFRPANFYSPYEALIWSVISARRARPQGIGLRTRLAETFGASFTVAGESIAAVPTPAQLKSMESLPGLPVDRIPRLHAIAEAAQRGLLSAERLRALPPEEARLELQKLPGIGPFYSALVVIRALGHTDALSTEEGHSRAAVQELYEIDHELSEVELVEIAEAWRPFRTWVAVMLRAVGPRAGLGEQVQKRRA